MPVQCAHCGRSITLRAGLEWRHLDQNTICCDLENWRNSTLATPKETS